LGNLDMTVFLRAVISTLTAQLHAIPDGSFETELPEFDMFLLDEIESLRHDIASSPYRASLTTEWEELRRVGQRWHWDITGLSQTDVEEDEESDEEGEYAPVVVDM
jgi:A1 cistron-splicing factor AAR2